MLKEQLLHMLLEGRYAIVIEAYLSKVEIRLPGPWFFVISVSYEEETGITERFLIDMQKELEQLSDASEATFIYAVCNIPLKLISVICSVEYIEKKDEICENIFGVAGSFSYEPVGGVGNEYNTLKNLAASWLESMDGIQHKKENMKNAQSREFVYEGKEMQKVVTALEMNNEAGALEALESYILRLRQAHVSMLMQQYIFADFIGEIARLGNKFHLELSRQNISMLITSKNFEDFEASARNIIHDFCKGYSNMKKQLTNEELYTVYEYINTHFSEYDMSIEKAAEDLHVSTGVVRKAIAEYTGKTYKDYIIYLRIEYAKLLLRTEDLSVAEICRKTGYGGISYFIKLFREVTGVTPAKYKQNYTEKY